MDALRDAAGISLRRVYGLYPSKDALVVAYLDWRDRRWRRWLRQAVVNLDSDQPVLAVFDALHTWFRSPDFRGCALVNATAELGGDAPGVRRQAKAHKRAVRRYLRELLRDADHPSADTAAAELMLIVDGAIVQASVAADGQAAMRAKDLARRLLAV